MTPQKILHLNALIAFAATFVLSAPPSRAQGPSPAATEVFNRYIASTEARSTTELSTQKDFLFIDALPTAEQVKSYAALRHGQTLFRPQQPCQSNCTPPPAALIHDYTAIIFVPGLILPVTLATLQDYNRDADYYRPQVLRAQLLSHSENTFRVALRLQQTRVLTVVLDSEYEITYLTLDSTQAASQSRSTKIGEIENPGLPSERPLAPNHDHGFLWRLNSYWRFRQADGGVYIQCHAISLTRDIPAGLGWMVAPFLEHIPHESLEFTLTATRQALLKQFPQANKMEARKVEHHQ